MLLTTTQVSTHPRSSHQHRPETYGPFDYFGEFGDVLGAMRQMNLPRTDLLLGPSLATGDWTPESAC